MNDQFDRNLAAAADALEAAIRSGVSDGGQIVCLLLARVAANLGGVHQVTAGRPGSWEASYVDQMLASTVGPAGEYLLQHRTAPIEVIECVPATFVDLGIDHLYDDAYELVEQTEREGETWLEEEGCVQDAAADRLAHAEQLIQQVRQADETAYQQAFQAQVQAAARRLVEDAGLPESVPVTVRFVDWKHRAESTGERGEFGTVDYELWETALTNTTLPAFPELPAQPEPASVLRRIPELAHYADADTTGSQGGESQ